MTVSTTRARHRAARRPSTPLTEFASAASDQMGTVGRRTAVVVGTSGLVVSMLGSSASAATGGDAGALPAVDTAALTASARAVLNTSPVVTAPVDAAWTFDAPVVTAETPPPPPPPVRAAPAASRSTTRAATATTDGRRRDDQRRRPAVGRRQRGPRDRRPLRGHPVRLRWHLARTASTARASSRYVYGAARHRRCRARRAGSKAAGTVVSRADAQPGDLIWSPGHISIYAGGNDADRLAPPGQDGPVPRHLAELSRLHPDRLTPALRRRGPDDTRRRGLVAFRHRVRPSVGGGAYSGRAPRCCFASPGRQPAGPTPEVGRTPCS